MDMRSYLEKKEHFGLRKLSTGLASVLLATTFMTAGHSQTVHADSTNKDDHEATDENVPENDTKDFMTQDEDNSQEVKINYVDANNETVSTQIAHLNKGDKITYAVPDGYKADNDLTDKFDGEKTEITVKVTKQETAKPQEQNKQENAEEVADNDKQTSPSQQETKKQTEKADTDQAKPSAEKAKTDTVKDDTNIAKQETAKTDSIDQAAKNVKLETKQAEPAKTTEKVAEPTKADNQTANKEAQAKPSSELKSSLIDQKANESTSVVNANANEQDNNQAKPQKAPLDQNAVEKTTDNLLDDSANYFDDTPINSLIDNRANSFMAAPLGVVDSRANDESNRNLTARLNALYSTSFIATGGGSNPNYPNLTIDNWTDPTAWGMVKTSVGWIYPNSRPKYMANKSNSYIYSGNHVKDSGTHTIGLKDVMKDDHMQINATIDVATANASTNQDVLLFSIPRLINDPSFGEAGHLNSWASAGLELRINNNRTVYDKYSNEIGTIWVDQNQNTAQVWFHNTGSNYSSDVNVQFDGEYVEPHLAFPNNYQYMAKTGKIFSEEFFNSDGSSVRYDHTYNPAQDDETNLDGSDQNWSNPNNLGASASWDGVNMGGAGTSFATQMDSPFRKVLSFSYQDNSGKIVPIASVGGLHAVSTMRLTDGTHYINSYRYDLYLPDPVRLADNLSIQEVYDQTPAGSTSYSVQKDGSILLGYNINANQYKYTDQQINEAIDSQYYFNYPHPEQKEQWREATLDAYHERNMVPVYIGDMGQFITPSTDQAFNALVMNVTPGEDTQKASDHQKGNSTDGKAGYMQNALVKYVDKDTGKQVGIQTISGGQDTDEKFKSSVPSDYVLVNNTDRDFTYHFTHDNNPDKTIYVMSKIVGQSTRNMKENADGLLNYDLSQVRGYPNVQIIQDDDKVFNIDPKDPNSLYNQARAIGDDYDNQENTIYQQIEQYEQELAKYNKAKAQMSFDQQPPKLVLHYHNNVLQESVSPEWKLIQQKPDGTTAVLQDIRPTFSRTGAVNLVDKSVDWFKGDTDWYYGYFDKNGTIHKDDHITDGWQLTNAGGLDVSAITNWSHYNEYPTIWIMNPDFAKKDIYSGNASGLTIDGRHDTNVNRSTDGSIAHMLAVGDLDTGATTHELRMKFSSINNIPQIDGYQALLDYNPYNYGHDDDHTGYGTANFVGLFGSNDPLQMHDNTTTIHYSVERDWRVIEDMPDGSEKVAFELKGTIPLLPDGKYGVNNDYNYDWLRQYLPYGEGLNQSTVTPGIGDSTNYTFKVDTKDGYTTVFSNMGQDTQFLNYNQAINLSRNADGTWTFDLFYGFPSEYSTLAPSHDWHIKYTPTITQTQENDQSHFVIQQQNPNPADHGNLYQQKIGDRSVLYRFSASGHRAKYHNEVTNQDTYSNWIIDHYYAPDSQGIIHDLGSAEFKQDPSSGLWGFWDVYDKYAPLGYQVQPNEVYTPYGKGPNSIPGYDLQSTVADSGTVHFDGNSSWITFDNLDTPDDVANMVSGNHTVTISYTPIKNQNTISYQLTDPTNPDKNIHDHFNTGLADAITTDQVGTIGLNSYKNAVNKNMYESYQTVLQNSYVDSIKVSVNGQDKVYKFQINGDNTISIILPDGRTMTESQYEAYAKQNLDPIRGFSFKTVTDRDGNLRISPESMVVVSDETLPINSDDCSTNDGALTNERNDDLPTMFRMYAPSITYNLQAMGNKKTDEPANNTTVSDTFTIHYNIPEQMTNYTESTTENDVYKISAQRDQYTEYDWEYLGYDNPIYDMEPDGNGGYEMVQIGSEPAYGYVPHQIDTGWYDSDINDDNANQISIDDIVGNKLSDSAPFVFNDKATPLQAGGYRLVIYGYDKSGKRVDLTNDLNRFVQVSRSDGSTDYYFAPYYNKGLTNYTDYIGNYLNDDELENDIYVTYEPVSQTKQIEYVDIQDYPDKDEGQLVATDQISGMQSSTVTVQYHIPAGYVKDETGNEEVPDTYTFNPDNNNTPIIVYIHAASNMTQNSHTYHRTIKFAGDFNSSSITWDNGNTVTSDSDGNIGSGSWNFSQSSATNTLTGEKTDGEWVADQNGSGDFSQVGLSYDAATKTVRGLVGKLNLPEGYHAYLNGDRNNEITEINEATIDQDSPDQDIVITITKGDVGQKVEYIDDDGNVVGQEEDPLEGQIGDKVSLNLAIPAGYDLAKTQSDPSVNITSSDPNNPIADITITKDGVSKIHVTMALIPVYHYDPKTPEDVMPGKDPDDSSNHFPQGVGKYDLNRTITRTINVNLPSGGYTIVQKVVLYRDAWVNPGSKAITFMDADKDNGYGKGTGWKFDAKNSSETIIQASGMGAFKQFDAPQVNGYAPSISTINEYAPLPDDKDQIINIDYAKTDDQITVVYDDVDQTGKEITRYHMNKDAQDNGTGVKLTIPDGYEFASETDRDNFDQINSGNSAGIHTNYGNPNLFTIHFREKVKDIADSDPAAKRTIKRQVVIVNPDNTRDSVTIEVHMKRQAIYNEVTKSTHYGDWKVDSVPVTIYDHTKDDGDDDGIVTGDLLKGDKNDEFNKYFGNNTATITEINGHTAVVIPRINIPQEDGYATMIDNANSSGVNLSNEYVPMEVLLMNTGDKINDQLGTETQDMTITNTDNSGFDQDQDLTKTIVAHYVADEHEMTYKYVDIDNNQTIKGDSVIGNAGDTVDFDNELPDGYELADGQTNFPDSYTFSDSDKRNQTKIVYVKNTEKPAKMLSPITSTTVELYTGKIYPDNQVRLQATDFGKVYQRYLKDPTEDNAFAVLQQLFPGLDKSDSILGSGRGTVSGTTGFYSTAINSYTLQGLSERSDTPMSARSALNSFADAISDLRDADGKHARSGCIVDGSFKLIVSRDGKRQELTTKFDTNLPNADKSDYLNQRYKLGSVVRYNKVSKGTVNGMPVSGLVPEYGPVYESSDYEDMEKAVNDNSESEAEQILSKMVKQYHVGDKVRIDDMDVLNYLFPNIGGKEIYMSNDDSNALGVIKAIYNGAKDQFEYLNEHPVENDDTPRPIIGYVPLVITPKGNADDETVSATLQFGNDMEQIRQQYAERHPNQRINI